MVVPAVLHDTGPLSFITNPKRTGSDLACYRWFRRLAMTGRRVIVPEICDYELRRELLWVNKTRSISELDLLGLTAEYLPISTPTMKLAAGLWADARRHGRPTASNDALDGDVILAAQALLLGQPVVVATSNVGHIGRYVPAADWTTIV